MQPVDRRTRAAAPWIWAALSFTAWFASLLIALPLAGPVLGPGPVDGLRWDLAGFLALIALLGGAAVLGAGRLAFGRWLPLRPADLVLPVVGVLLGIAAELALHEWAEARFGYYDVELIGLTTGLGAASVLTAVATFGVLIAPSGAAFAPRTAQIVGALLVGLVVASNVPGLGDGIDATSWPLAILVGLCALFVYLAVALSWTKVGR